MNSVKDISEALIKIAYADKTDRIEMIAKLAKDFQAQIVDFFHSIQYR